jgi:hypothetical protein
MIFFVLSFMFVDRSKQWIIDVPFKALFWEKEAETFTYVDNFYFF